MSRSPIEILALNFKSDVKPGRCNNFTIMKKDWSDLRGR